MMGQFLVVENPDNLALLDHGPTVLLFITGLYCSHCYEQVEKFDRELSAAGIKLVVVSGQEDSEDDLVARMKGTLIADPKQTWAGWFGLAHGDDSHGTLLLDQQGKEVWRTAGHEPFMDAASLIARARKLQTRTTQVAGR